MRKKREKHIFMYMNADKIFGLFGDEEGSKPDFNHDTDLSYLLEDYKEHPMFWVGMFKKLIHNHRVFNTKVMSFFTKLENDELDLYDVENAGEFVVYNRAWFWIDKIDILDGKCQEVLLHYADDYFETYLKFSISYWEETEEFEKCAKLKSILDFIS
tara:strand:- start:481 stop:951 length:471 start_codon:yes stop_codon:yes gene_type:complete